MAEFTPQGLSQAWRSRSGRVAPEVRRFVRTMGKRILRVSKEHLRKQIYSIAEDRTASGKKRWVRTRRLINAETLRYAPDGAAVTLTNDTVYARARHELGRDGRKTQRPAHWREGIFTETRSETEADLRLLQQRIVQGGA